MKFGLMGAKNAGRWAAKKAMSPHDPTDKLLRQSIMNLSKVRGPVRFGKLENMLDAAKNKSEISVIMQYVRSDMAKNLAPQDRAHLVMMCVEKLSYLSFLKEFL